MAFNVCDAEPANFEETHVKASHERAWSSYRKDGIPVTTEAAHRSA